MCANRALDRAHPGPILHHFFPCTTCSYEKTQANLHAAGGALISIRRIQRAATLRPLQEPRPFGDADGDVAASGAVAPFSPAVSSMTSTSTLTTGGLTAEIRGFLRNSFAPMIRAAFEHLLADQAKDPLGYLAQWFWMHSELNTKHVRVADHRSDKVKIETLRSQVLPLPYWIGAPPLCCGDPCFSCCTVLAPVAARSVRLRALADHARRTTPQFYGTHESRQRPHAHRF